MRISDGVSFVGEDHISFDIKVRKLIHLSDVVYFEAGHKCLSIRTRDMRYLTYGSVAAMQKKAGAGFVRVSRSALVNVSAISGLRNEYNDEGQDVWMATLHGCPETIEVARRELANVRKQIKASQ